MVNEAIVKERQRKERRGIVFSADESRLTLHTLVFALHACIYQWACKSYIWRLFLMAHRRRISSVYICVCAVDVK